MSMRINHTLSVIRYILDRCTDATSRETIKELRIEAQEEIASREGIDSTTVSDKYRRQLRPQVKNTEHFDNLLTEWIKQGSPAPCKALLTHSVDYEDEKRVRDLFSDTLSYDKTNRKRHNKDVVRFNSKDFSSTDELVEEINDILSEEEVNKLVDILKDSK